MAGCAEDPQFLHRWPLERRYGPFLCSGGPKSAFQGQFETALNRPKICEHFEEFAQQPLKPPQQGRRADWSLAALSCCTCASWARRLTIATFIYGKSSAIPMAGMLGVRQVEHGPMDAIPATNEDSDPGAPRWR